MTNEQVNHMDDNWKTFSKKYAQKYAAGQLEHGGNMWEMGAYQALENMEDEILDQWSYARQIRKCLDEIAKVVELYDGSDGQDGWRQASKIKEILTRIKND